MQLITLINKKGRVGKNITIIFVNGINILCL
jgi:hypothetical protein